MSPHLNRRTLLAAAGAAGSVLATGSGCAQRSDPVVTTTNGPVRGTIEDGINRFLGIRYGADTARTRFRAPARPDAWTDTLDATGYGSASPQGRNESNQSEDCLFLNVWTPGLEGDAARPVMVYFHGGAYAAGSGSSPLYDGTRLCQRGDVVVVTVNHRLNAFGYLYLQRLLGPDFASSGNAGQLDLVLALQWVRDNAARFGGDPGRVMVFGQSGGGAKIASLMATPVADGLFHSAATMSGQQVTASGPANATARARAYLAGLGLDDAHAHDVLALPMEALVEGLGVDDPVLPYGRVYFGPVRDDVVLPRHPFYPDVAPQSRHIPMIIGNTRDETRAFLRGPQYENLDWDDLQELLIPNMRVDIRPETVIARYRELYPERSAEEIFYAATTAARSWRGAVIEAEERAKVDTPTWVYQLDFGNPYAPHTFDIPLVFDNTAVEGALPGNGETARNMAALMSEAFIALARTGTPHHAALPDWSRYTLPNRETMIFDWPPRMENDPRGAERELFASVPYVQPGT
ncbi:carboxylesterase/lipase family protein [Maricaulis sp.]|uniref:carboxylesterase/lipase family protein n=1 Tax=Maricaulis sp. TaxID=1486257 RepID=UPI000C4F22C7|nr:carboxylesterase/lipase family protein [Maricaulis sp.]MAC89136.1 carboxylesterase [Maricaulis sp.]